jgi:hypothetical protein
MRNLAKPLAWLLGVVLTLVGLAGFFVDGQLLYFEVDTTHNLIHLASGLAALFAASKGPAASRLYLLVFGAVYALVTVLGFWKGSVLGLISVNAADNWLHLAIAAASLIVGFMAGEEASPAIESAGGTPAAAESKQDLGADCGCGSGNKAGACCMKDKSCGCGGGKAAGDCCFAKKEEPASTELEPEQNTEASAEEVPKESPQASVAEPESVPSESTSSESAPTASDGDADGGASKE